MVSFFVPYRLIGPLTPLNLPKPDSNENVRMAKEQEDLVKQLLSYLYRTKEYWRFFLRHYLVYGWATIYSYQNPIFCVYSAYKNIEYTENKP